MLRHLLLCAFVIFTPVTARASLVSLTPVYVQSFDSSLTSLGTLANNGASTPLDGYLQFEVRLTFTDAAPDEDFWTAAFNINLGPGLTNSSGWMDPGTAQANGYYPSAPSLAEYDSNGATAGGIEMHWQNGNGDFGINPNDLQAIIVEAASAEAANRQYGEAGRPGAGSQDALGDPTLIGTFIVQRTELVSSSIGITPISGSPWGSYVSNLDGQGVPTSHTASSFTGGTLSVPAPEPSSLLLAAFAAGALVVRRGYRLHGARS
ncbi:MAG TPA: hypothetical protein VGG64_15285 [Pirellulales bacterium]|jgi:hypothetical protein